MQRHSNQLAWFLIDSQVSDHASSISKSSASHSASRRKGGLFVIADPSGNTIAKPVPVKKNIEKKRDKSPVLDESDTIAQLLTTSRSLSIHRNRRTFRFLAHSENAFYIKSQTWPV